MKKAISVGFIALFALLMPVSGAYAANNLVKNGGFEANTVNNAYNWYIYPSGTPGLGWNVEWYGGSNTYVYEGQTYTRPQVANLEIHRYYSGWNAQVPDQYAELDTDWMGPGFLPYFEPASVKISQTIAPAKGSCKKGETFELSYSWGARPNVSENKMDVYWNGNLIKSHQISGVGNADIVWNDTTVRKLGTKNGKIDLAFVETGNPEGLGMLLDDVAVFRKCNK